MVPYFNKKWQERIVASFLPGLKARNLQNRALKTNVHDQLSNAVQFKESQPLYFHYTKCLYTLLERPPPHLPSSLAPTWPALPNLGHTYKHSIVRSPQEQMLRPLAVPRHRPHLPLLLGLRVTQQCTELLHPPGGRYRSQVEAIPHLGTSLTRSGPHTTAVSTDPSGLRQSHQFEIVLVKLIWPHYMSHSHDCLKEW